MQCLQYHLIPEVHARSSEQPRIACVQALPMQNNSSSLNLQRSRAASASTRSNRRGPVLRATMQDEAVQTVQQANAKTLLCTSVTASTFDQAIIEIRQIAEAGADLIELRLDMLNDFNVEQHLQQLLATTNVPKVVTLRPVWEGSAFSPYAQKSQLSIPQNTKSTFDIAEANILVQNPSGWRSSSTLRFWELHMLT